MKILFVTNCFPVENRLTYGIFVKEQVDALASRHQDISYDIFFINGLKGKIEYAKSVVAIRRQIKRNSYDLVHVHYGLSGLFLLFGKIDIPVVVTLHGGDILTQQGKLWQVRLSQQIIQHADEVIVLNNNMFDAIKQYARHSILLPCSVNTTIFSPNKQRCKKHEGKTINVLFPSSRNRPVKNQPLYESTCDILEKQYGYKVVRTYLEGFTRQEVARLYNEIDIMLLTSISEGSPGVVKEAMACNVPIVSTNVGDVSINLEGVANCYVSLLGTDADLAEGVVKCMKGSVSGVSGREKILKLGLDDGTITDKLYNVYSSLLTKK